MLHPFNSQKALPPIWASLKLSRIRHWGSRPVTIKRLRCRSHLRAETGVLPLHYARYSAMKTPSNLLSPVTSPSPFPPPHYLVHSWQHSTPRIPANPLRSVIQRRRYRFQENSTHENSTHENSTHENSTQRKFHPRKIPPNNRLKGGVYLT